MDVSCIFAVLVGDFSIRVEISRKGKGVGVRGGVKGTFSVVYTTGNNFLGIVGTRISEGG